jgi:hypothetical protein
VNFLPEPHGHGSLRPESGLLLTPQEGFAMFKNSDDFQETVNVSFRCDDEIGRGHDEEYSGHGNRNDLDVCAAGSR